MTEIPPNSLVASEAFVVPLEDPNDPSADEWARLDAANADTDAMADYVPKEKLRALLAKWKADRADYPANSVIGTYTRIAMKLCEEELAGLIGEPS